MEANARNLGNLQNKVESVHQASVDDRDVVSKAKQEQLRGKYIHIYQCSHGHKHLFPNRPFHFCNCSILREPAASTQLCPLCVYLFSLLNAFKRIVSIFTSLVKCCALYVYFSITGAARASAA